MKQYSYIFRDGSTAPMFDDRFQSAFGCARHEHGSEDIALTKIVERDEQNNDRTLSYDEARCLLVRNKVEGLVVAIEGNCDWETCKTPGLQAAFAKVDNAYHAERVRIANLVSAGVPDDVDALFAPETDEQSQLRAQLEEESKQRGYATGFEGEGTRVWFMTTPVGKITIANEAERLVFNSDHDGANVARQRIIVELY